MDQLNNQETVSSPKEAELEGRREAMRKLGKYAAYAAPFTLLATNTKAQQSGGGSGGRIKKH